MKNTNRSVKWLIILLAFPFLAVSAETGPAENLTFNLVQAQEYALQHNYDIQRSQYDLAVAKKKLKEILAGGLPQVSSSISYNNNLALATTLIPNFFEGKPDEMVAIQFGTKHNTTFNLTVNQLVFNGSYIVGLQSSKIFRELSEKSLQLTQNDVRQLVANTYYLILITQESSRILSQTLKNLQKTHYEIEERFKEGFVEETDSDMIEISIIKLSDSLESVTEQTKVAFKLLKYQMGLDLDQSIQLSDKLEFIVGNLDINSLEEAHFNLERNVTFQLMKTQEKLAAASFKNEKSKYLPTISAFVSYNRNAMRNEFNFLKKGERWFTAAIFGLRIDIPIFKSGAQKAKTQQAGINLKKAWNDRIQASEGLRLAYTQAKTNLRNLYKQYQSALKSIKLSQKVYQHTWEKYREGIASSMDLTQAHNQHLSTQSDYIATLSGLLGAKNELEKILNRK